MDCCDFCSDDDNLRLVAQNEDSYVTNFGTKIVRRGKVFSQTVWRTQIGKEVFWSLQGFSNDGSNWIVTQYFGPAEKATKFKQEITVRHPTEKRIKMCYASTIENGQNCVRISKWILQHFKNKDNTFDFEFRLVKLKKRKPHAQLRTL